MEENFSEDYEIVNTENFRKGNEVFSHESLVMDILRRCTEAGSHELRPGWFNERVDRNGNVNKIYIEDTRKRFIETVKTATCVMCCYYDKQANETINKLLDNLKEFKNKLLKLQWEWYQNLAPKDKDRYNGKVSPNFFNSDLIYYLSYMDSELLTYRKVLNELHLLAERKQFFKNKGGVTI